MAIVSLIRTAERSALTVSGLALFNDIDISLARKPVCNAAHGFVVSSNAGAAAAIVNPCGRSGVLFGHESKELPPDAGHWCREVLRRSLEQDDLDDGASWLADRLLADDRPAFTGLLSDYGQCHTVRFARPGHPYVTTVLGNYSLLSFWKEHPGLTLANRAYERFELWVEAGLQDPLALLPFHLVTDRQGESPTDLHGLLHHDVLQIRQPAHGTSADLRLWHRPVDVAERPALSLSADIADGHGAKSIVIVPE